jgi:hypothetical protein
MEMAFINSFPVEYREDGKALVSDGSAQYAGRNDAEPFSGRPSFGVKPNIRAKGHYKRYLCPSYCFGMCATTTVSSRFSNEILPASILLTE